MTKKVLIAEDDPGDVFLLQRAFNVSGVPATLHFVRDGQEAIDYLGGQAPTRIATRTRCRTCCCWT